VNNVLLEAFNLPPLLLQRDERAAAVIYCLEADIDVVDFVIGRRPSSRRAMRDATIAAPDMLAQFGGSWLLRDGGEAGEYVGHFTDSRNSWMTS
jgi:hypothetical protein